MKLSLHAHYTSSSEASMNPHAKVARPATESKKAGQHTTNASQAGIDAPRECSRAAADCVASWWSQDAAPGLRCTHDVRHALLQRPQLQKGCAIAEVSQRNDAVAATANSPVATDAGTSTT